MKSGSWIVAAALALAACATPRTPEPVIVTKDVPAPYPVPCVPANLAAAPTGYPDTDAALLAAPDAARRYQLLQAGRELRGARLGAVEPVIAGCRDAAAKVGSK